MYFVSIMDNQTAAALRCMVKLCLIASVFTIQDLLSVVETVRKVKINVSLETTTLQHVPRHLGDRDPGAVQHHDHNHRELSTRPAAAPHTLSFTVRKKLKLVSYDCFTNSDKILATSSIYFRYYIST